MTHAQLVSIAVKWLRSYRCGVVLSEQACLSGEMPDAIGWKRACHSVLVECKVTRADFLSDRSKPFRHNPEKALGCERFYLTPAGLVRLEELPKGWGLLEFRRPVIMPGIYDLVIYRRPQTRRAASRIQNYGRARVTRVTVNAEQIAAPPIPVVRPRRHCAYGSRVRTDSFYKY